MIYAKKGIIIDDNQKKTFQLFRGKVLNNEKKKINIFEFDQIDFNLADYSSNSIIIYKPITYNVLFPGPFDVYAFSLISIGSSLIEFEENYDFLF